MCGEKDVGPKERTDRPTEVREQKGPWVCSWGRGVGQAGGRARTGPEGAGRAERVRGLWKTRVYEETRNGRGRLWEGWIPGSEVGGGEVWGVCAAERGDRGGE